MKGIYNLIEFNKFLLFLENICLKDKKIIITILTWDDGDYFEELCEEDGGIIKEHISFFRNKPLCKKIKNYMELKEELFLAKNIPYFSSKNGNYRLFYDIHIWIGKHYICYNIFLGKYFYKIHNLFQRILGLAVFPEWQKSDGMPGRGTQG